MSPVAAPSDFAVPPVAAVQTVVAVLAVVGWQPVAVVPQVV